MDDCFKIIKIFSDGVHRKVCSLIVSSERNLQISAIQELMKSVVLN